MGFFDSPQESGAEEITLQKAEDFSEGDKLSMEKEVAGMYLSGHPMADYAHLYRSGAYARIDQITGSAQGESAQYKDGQRVSLLAIVTGVRRKNTKNGGTMAFVTLEDMYGDMVGLVFPKVLEEWGGLLAEGATVEATGRLSFTEDKEPELVCDRFAPPPTGNAAPTVSSGDRPGLYLKVESKEDPNYKKALEYTAIFDEGRSDLYVFFRDTGKLMKAPGKYRTDVNPVLLSALRRLLGEENVACR